MFILKNLHIENFMSIDSADFSFEDNQITAITGQNGVGKSSLFYAIAFCLTGFRKGDAYSNYVKTGTTEAKVVLDALFNDKPIHYDTTIDKGTHKTVIYDGTTYTNSEYDQFIKQYNLDELGELMFMFQGTTSIIDARPKERSNKLKKLFKLEFPDIVNKLKEQQDNVKTENSQLTAVATELQNIKSEQLPMLREVNDEYLQQCKDNLTIVSNKLSQTNDIDASELTSIENELVYCQKQINDAESKISFDKKGLQTSETRLKDIEESINKYNIEDLKKSIDDAQKSFDKHTVKYEKDKKSYESITGDLKIVNYKKKELDAQYEISKTGVCHACGQPIEESHINKLKEEIDSVETNINELNDKLTKLNFDVRDAKGKELSKALDYSKEQLNKYENDLKSKDVLISRIEELKSVISDREGLVSELNEKKNLLIKNKEALNKLIPLINERENLIKEKEGFESIIKNAEESRIKNIERRNTNQRILREKQERENKIKVMTDKINNLSLTMSKLKTEIDIFENKFPNYVTLQTCNKLEAYINDIVQKVFPYCKVSLKLDGQGLGVYYTSESSEEEYIPVSMASGCQRQILALAYFVALARLSGITCVFLDEIDASSSAENAKVIYEFIASLDCFNQIFFISHRPEAHQAVKEHNEELVTYLVESGNYSEI